MARPNNDAGFTLLEVLAVLAIVTLVIAIALPRIGMNASPAATEAMAMRMIAALEAERYAARRRATTLETQIDTNTNRLRLATRREPMQLPPTISLGTRAAPACDPGGRRIIFYADGTACGPVILLTSATAKRAIIVNPLTGAISLAP